MIIPGKMQASLVSFYGKKPDELESFISSCQNKITEIIGDSFLPYQLAQVHGTIIGLEGTLFKDKIENANFKDSLSETLLLDPSAFLAFVRSDNFPLIEIKIGGYYKGLQNFESQNKDPYERSFSVNGDIVVAMGWPTVAANKKVLDHYRRQFNTVSVLHKWHRKPGDVDDDFYFVLGRVNGLNAKQKNDLTTVMRAYLAEDVTPIIINLDQQYLSVVAYMDSQLPLKTSCAFPVLENALNPETLLALYPSE